MSLAPIVTVTKPGLAVSYIGPSWGAACTLEVKMRGPFYPFRAVEPVQPRS